MTIKLGRVGYAGMAAIVLLLGVFSFLWGEKVPAGGGLGGDGVTYAKMVRDLPRMVSQGELNTYYAQRSLLPLAAGSFLRASDIALTNANIIRVFEVGNLLLLLLGVWLWKRIASVTDLPLPLAWVGFGAIFLNFQASKQAFYYPVLMDVATLTLGLALLLFHLTHHRWALLLTTLAGSFIWPTASVTGAILLLFAGGGNHVVVVERAESWRRPLLRAFVIFLSCAAVLLWGLMLLPDLAAGVCSGALSISASFLGLLERLAGTLSSTPDPCGPARKLLTSLPTVIGMLVLVGALLGTLRGRLMWHAARARVSWSSLLLALAALVIPAVVVWKVAAPEVPNPSSLAWLAQVTLFPGTGEGKLLMPLVSIAVFWGPAVLVMLLLWRSVCAGATSLGPGVVGVLAVSLPFAAVGEPRFLTLAWPFLVTGLLVALRTASLPRAFYFAFATLTVLFGQFWIRINVAPWPGGDEEHLLEFPKQMYFMHYGLWMGWPAYVAQAGVLLLSAFWLAYTLRPAIGGYAGSRSAASPKQGPYATL